MNSLKNYMAVGYAVVDLGEMGVADIVSFVVVVGTAVNPAAAVVVATGRSGLGVVVVVVVAATDVAEVVVVAVAVGTD